MPAPKKFTDEQIIEALKLIHAGQSSYRKEAEKLGTAHKIIISRENSLAKQGIWVASDSVLNKAAPAPYYLKRRSEYTSKDGETCGWNIYEPDKQKQHEAMLHAIEAACEEIPRLKPVKPPLETLDDYLNLYTLTDLHIGMLANHRENLEGNWDLKIAEQTVIDCFSRMIGSSIGAKHCIINELGDFIQSDSIMPLTPSSGHILDVDGRFGKVVEAAIRIMRAVVDMALAKHETVTIIMAEGNHNISSSIWMRRMFCVLYENEPRVTIIDSDLPFYCTTFGSVMICAHHGHLKRNDDLPLLFASQFAKEWGSTTKRYCHTGHRHHLHVKEHSGMTVIQHPTMIPRDSHASRHGYLSDRRALSFTYHREHGEIASNYVYPVVVK